MKRMLTMILVNFLVSLILATAVSLPALAFDSVSNIVGDPVNRAEIFSTHCAGCHINGGNIVRRNKTLKLKALQKNKMDSLAAITEIVTNGKGNMSAYRERLTTSEIQAVSAYVLQQAETGWKVN